MKDIIKGPEVMSVIMLSLIEYVSLLVGYYCRNKLIYPSLFSNSDYLLLCGLMVVIVGINYSLNIFLFTFIGRGGKQQPSYIFSNSKLLFFITFIITLSVWSIYFYFSFPGGAWYDTGNQICQYMGVETINRANPLLQTIMSGCAFKIGILLGKAEYGIAMYIMAQMIVSALIVSYLMISLSRLLPSALTVFLVVCAYVINPVVPIYVVNIGKDTNFGFQILLALVCITNISARKQIDIGNGLLLFISLVLISLLRNAGILFAFLVSISFFFITNEKMKSIILCLSSFAIVLVFHISTSCYYNYSSTKDETENLSIPLLQMGSYINSYYEELDENEIEIINNVLDIQQVRENFNANISDPLKVNYAQHDPSKKQLNEFWNLYFSFMRRHPRKFIEVLIEKSYGYFDPLTGEIIKPFTVIGLSPISKYIEEMLGITLKNTGRLTKYIRFIELLKETKVLKLLTHCGFYMWLQLFGLFMAYRYKTNRMLMFPIIGFIVGLIATPVNAYFRYCFPIVLVAPFWVLMVYSVKKTE